MPVKMTVGKTQEHKDRIDRKTSALYSSTPAGLKTYIQNADNTQLRELIFILAMEVKEMNMMSSSEDYSDVPDEEEQ